MNEYVTGYALAIFDLGKAQNSLNKLKDDSEDIIHALEENREIISIIDSKQMTDEDKHALIKSAFSSTVDRVLVNFLLLTSDRNKFKLVTKSLKKLIKYINVDFDIIEGTVYSIELLDELKLANIETKVSEQLGKKVSLTNKKDEALLAGIKVVVDDMIIEDTIESRLNQIKAALLENEEI